LQQDRLSLLHIVAGIHKTGRPFQWLGYMVPQQAEPAAEAPEIQSPPQAESIAPAVAGGDDSNLRHASRGILRRFFS
jgi:hypothetical protein